MEKTELNIKNSNKSNIEWPLLLRISPKTILYIVFGYLIIAWISFIAVDIFNLVSINIDGVTVLSFNLFNNRPVEWSQWFLLVYAIVSAAFISGRLFSHQTKLNISKFFLQFSIGLGFMLIEEAGDIRHYISYFIRATYGWSIFGLSATAVSDVFYFAILSSVPLYALLRYGRYVWEYINTRRYLITGVVLYGVIAIANGIRYQGGFYRNVGAWIDRVIFLNRFPVPEGMSQYGAHHFLVDAIIEETIETMAIAFILAAILAFVGEIRLASLNKADGKVKTSIKQ